MSPLAQSIYQALAFFDAQDLPLTLLELSNYLVAPTPSEEREGQQAGVRLSDIEKVILNELAHKIGHKDGFYFLKGREKLLSQRQDHYRISLQRFRKARRYLRSLRFFPYLRAVAISGSQALLGADQQSDIDLFLITKRNRIWLTRMFVSLYFQLVRQRRHGLRIKGRFCLNHYLGEGLAVSQDQNLYTAVEYASFIPVIGEDKLERFWKQNVWVAEYLKNPLPERANMFFGYQFSWWQKVLEVFLDATVGPALNYLAGLYQKQRIKLGEYIIVTDEELSFHPGSRGQKVLAEYQRKLV